VIAPGTRFQVQYTTPLAGVSSFVEKQDALKVMPAYERALFADLQKVLDVIPHDRVAVQWDIPLEIGVLEAPEWFAVAAEQDLDTSPRSGWPPSRSPWCR